MKISVYAICKNEEKNILSWYESIKDADEICVLDTGSTDNSIKILKELGVKVKRKIINPFRFDIARNESLKMVSKDADICICLDLDERFNPNWRLLLENNWQKDTNRCRYTYNWSLDENNNPLVTFYYEKVHSRNNYKWIYPVHEVLSYQKDKENYITIDKIVLNHYPDSQKSRSNYLPLLELSIKENPLNDRNLHYLGREYMYHNMYNEAIDTLIKHLKIATWKEEKSASMRFIARCYDKLKRYDEAKMWLMKAIKETPYLRDQYVELAFLYDELNNYSLVITYLKKALKIKNHEKVYINEVFSWDNTIYDLLSISYFNLGLYKESLRYIKKALKMKPNDERLKENLIIIKKKSIEVS